jgi:hypothetical protein
MSNKRISELPYIDQTKISGNTLVPLVTYYSAVTGATVHTFVDDFKDYILSGTTFTGNTSATCISDLYLDNLHGCTTGVTLHNNIVPITDNTIDLGTPITRFRDINTVSGTSSYWTSTVKVITPELDLGLDSNSEIRTINANNSVIQNDILNGGNF